MSHVLYEQSSVSRAEFTTHDSPVEVPELSLRGKASELEFTVPVQFVIEWQFLQ